MSEHAATHDAGHGDGHGEEHHSHAKTYGIVGAILTVVTIIELVILPDILGGSLSPAVINWSLVILSVLKLFFVLGVFMHLKDDRQIYSILFVSPMIIATIMILVLMAMSIVSYDWTTKDPHPVVNEPGAVPAFVDWSEDQYKQEFAKTDHAVGKQVFGTYCAGCHRIDGGGGVGPAMTDNCYIHGGDFKNMESVLINGVVTKGMPKWKKVITDDEIRQVVMYIRSMRGQTVPNAKACQGNPVTN